MEMKSSAFKPGEPIPAEYTCDGRDVNPPLEFSGIPAGARSLVLIVDDPDAPSGTWVHWTVWNIDPRSSGVLENGQFEGATEGMTDSGRPGYGGPCPPGGLHRYFFKLYALDKRLDGLQKEAGIRSLMAAMDGHILEKAELVGVYSKK